MSLNPFVEVFDSRGKPTAYLRVQCLRAGVRVGLPGGSSLVEAACATSEFRGWWSKNLPAQPPLPTDPIVHPDGKPTRAFIEVFP